MNKIYDVIIIGGGPAGYTSALYAARAGLICLVIEKLSAGGQMAKTSKIDNYPGFNEGIDGFELGNKMKQGAERFGAETVSGEVISVSLRDKIKAVKTSDREYFAYSVIAATGAAHKHLGVKNEENFAGKGVGYCAACDGMFFKGKTAAVIGGGNSAAIDALCLSKICERVILVHRRDTLRAEKVYQQALKDSPNIEFLLNSALTEITGENKVSGIKVKNTESGEEKEIKTDGVFISIGRSPETKIFEGILKLDEKGYIVSDETTKTNTDGVFAAGDVRTKRVRQIVTATADGAAASHFAEEYLSTIKGM